MAILVTCALLSAAVAATAPVGAQSSDNPAADVLDSVTSVADENASFGLSTARAAVSGITARLSDFFSGIGNETTASQACGDLQSTFNANSASITSYANNRTNASTSADVLEIECDIDDSTNRVYLTADVNGSDYENATIDDSTSRTVDESCTLEDAAARNADDELDHVLSEFVTPGENISSDYRQKVTARYAGKVSCSFIG